MDDIENIVKQVVGQIASRQPGTQDKIIDCWQNILNREELKHTYLAGLNHGQLLVHVDSPAWLYQMNLKKGRILNQLKEKISSVQNIRFKIGKIK